MRSGLTLLYHTHEEMEVMHRLVQQAIDAGDPAGLLMLNSLRTMWAEAIDGASTVPMPTATVRLPLHDLASLIAITTGAVDRVRDSGSVEVVSQLSDLRLRLIAVDRQLRQDVGLPID